MHVYLILECDNKCMHIPLILDEQVFFVSCGLEQGKKNRMRQSKIEKIDSACMKSYFSSLNFIYELSRSDKKRWGTINMVLFKLNGPDRETRCFKEVSIVITERRCLLSIKQQN